MLLALCVDELGVADPRGDDRAERGEELEVALLELTTSRDVLALDDERAEWPCFPANGDGEEDREALLSEIREVLVGPVRARVVARDGPQVLDRLPRHALADRETDLTQRLRREADVAAHDELVAIALDEVERANVGLEDPGDSRWRFVEQGYERHRLRCECDEVEDAVEALVASIVDRRTAAPYRRGHSGSARFGDGAGGWR